MRLDEKARQFRKATQFQVLTAEVTNNEALSMASIYNYWKAGVGYGGDKQEKIVRRPVDGVDVLFECITPHTSQSDWAPELTPAMWNRIDVEHAGTEEDPIPAALNMMYYKDKYYIEGDVLYLCTRDSGIALAYLPSQLVGQYFEVVEV